MFRTDLNHFLQSFDSHLLYKFMEAVSFMGTLYMLLLTVLVLIAAINFKKGFLVLNILGWSVLVVIAAKQYIDFPRPIAVDTTLESFDKEKTLTDFTHLQPSSFFELFSEDILLKTRASDIGRQGFPSGHVAIITAVWLGMAFMFRKPWLCAISVSMVLLTILSRLYLGVHYLGDVIGGLALGLIFAFGFNALYKWLKLSERLILNTKQTLFLLMPLLLLFLNKIVPSFPVGALIGFNLGLFFIIKRWGELKLSATLGNKVANTLLFVLLYFSMYFLTKQLHLSKTGLEPLVIFSIAHFAILITSVAISKKIGFIKLE